MTDRSATFGCLLLGGLLGLVATAQAWWRAAGGGVSVAFTGTEASGGLSQALVVVALAGTLLVLVLQARGRRVVALLLALTALGVVVVGVLRLQPGGEAVRTKMRQVSLTDTFALTATAWPWVFAGAGLLVLAGAVLLWRGAPRWLPRASRFERSASPADSSAVPTLSAEDDPAAAWRALDAGLDPTAPDDQAGASRPTPLPSAIRPDVPEAHSRGHNGAQDHARTEAARSASPTGTASRTARPSPAHKETDGRGT